MTLDDFEDIEQLRGAARLLEAEVRTLTKMVLSLKRELHAMKHGKPEQLVLQLAELEAQLARRNKIIFGDKSEKRSRDKKSEPKKQRGHGRQEQLALEEVEELHLANVDADSCELCGGSLHASEAFFEESEEIDVIERRFVIKKHRRQKYKCECGSCIKTAPGPQKLFAGARYSINFALHVALAKYGDHLPLERQVKAMKRDGLQVRSQTLWDQLRHLAFELEAAYARQKEYVLSQSVIGADETHWKMLAQKEAGEGKRWQVWAICCPNAVHYSFENSRSAETARGVLEGFSGVVLSDGYKAYESVRKRSGKFELAHCWSHVRRKFVEVEELHPGQGEAILDLIGQLYDVERDAKERPPDKLLELRRERSKPITLAIQNWALEVETLPEGALGKAIKYMAGVWEGLLVFIDNPLVALDNNATERALRGIVMLVSLCVTSLNAWNHQVGIISRNPTRAA